MGEFYFSKALLSYGREVLLVFEQGGMGKPICVLDKHNIKALNKEWEEITSKAWKEVIKNG